MEREQHSSHEGTSLSDGSHSARSTFAGMLPAESGGGAEAVSSLGAALQHFDEPAGQVSTSEDRQQQQWHGSDASTASVPGLDSQHQYTSDVQKKVPRPSNAWILYRSDKIKNKKGKLKDGDPRPTQASLSQSIAEEWRNETEEVKGKYERLAEQARDEHAQKFPDWSFRRRPKLNTNSTASENPQARTGPKPSNPALEIKRVRTSSPPPQQPAEGHLGSFVRAGTDPSEVDMVHNAGDHGAGVQLHAPQHQHQQYVFPSPPRPPPVMRAMDWRIPPMPAGLDETLARRNSSAIALFNPYAQPSALIGQGPSGHVALSGSHTHPPPTRPLDLSVLEGTSPRWTRFPDVMRAAHIPADMYLDQGTWDHAASSGLPLVHTVEAAELAHMPWGLTQPSAPIAQAEGLVVREGTPFALRHPPPHMPELVGPTISEAHHLHAPEDAQLNHLGIPPWLRQYDNVRIRVDQTSGVPLRDFLLDLGARALAPVGLARGHSESVTEVGERRQRQHSPLRGQEVTTLDDSHKYAFP